MSCGRTKTRETARVSTTTATMGGQQVFHDFPGIVLRNITESYLGVQTAKFWTVPLPTLQQRRPRQGKLPDKKGTQTRPQRDRHQTEQYQPARFELPRRQRLGERERRTGHADHRYEQRQRRYGCGRIAREQP